MTDRHGPDDYVQRVLIAPRHLAGGGDPRYVTAPLRRGLGWKSSADPLVPRVQLTSPDRTAELSLAPHPRHRWWKLYGRPTTGPSWQAAFDGHTPVEIIAAYADALAAPAPDHEPASDPFSPLAQAGWSLTEDPHPTATSPDGTCQVQHHADDIADDWWVETVIPAFGGRRLWQAYIGNRTPPHLIHALTTAAADPAPVARELSDLPFGCEGLVTTDSAWERADRRIEARVAAARNTARRARRSSQQPPAAPQPPRTSPPRRAR
ncbi:DUF317 domain-containing protein [Streptomyces sp. NPDC050161]|uniref:DUF317 domain-containing protein n=1 Tax=Streptomyces sp. NPDC050161 TaxID=3365604 RepID=UPI0037B6002F